MSADDAPPLSEDEFSEELQHLLLRGADNGIQVEGAWECWNGPDYPDYDVVVTEVKKNDQTE
jgi:hypothetical protein